MEKKMMNTRLAVAAVVLLFGLLLAGLQEAAAVGYDDDQAAPATKKKAAPATEEATAPATDEEAAAPTTEAPAPATDAAEAPTTPSGGKKKKARASYSKVDCEAAGTCGAAKLAAADDPSRPGAVANPYTRGCNTHLGCRG